MMERVILGLTWLMCLVSLKKKWGSNSDDQIYYDREGLMNFMGLVGYWFLL